MSGFVSSIFTLCLPSGNPDFQVGSWRLYLKEVDKRAVSIVFRLEFSESKFHLNANDNISDINKETHVEIKDDTNKVILERTSKTSIGSRVITINAGYKKDNNKY